MNARRRHRGPRFKGGASFTLQSRPEPDRASMRRSLIAFFKDESGGSAIEYALIAVAIAINTITVVHAAFYRQ